ncbi:Fic family protein [Baekduia sp.]|uniref:Fic family protein n=1 Tax=Baekduia sp. TaxID=2600305 RepID=UPI002E07C52F|nr:Fic family protein [Baekduia sp.]
MRSFSDIHAALDAPPLDVVTLLGRIELGRGREGLYRSQAPQVLERLAAQTRFDSITASSAIENVFVDDDRALKFLRDPDKAGAYRDRSELEFVGYRDATDYLMTKGEREPLTVPLLLHLHRLLMQHTGDPLAGKLKTSDNLIGERAGGRVRVIFKTVPAGGQTEWHLNELVARYEEVITDAAVPGLLAVCALILDFLAVHPFQDGNGRIARLLTTHELLRGGWGVTRYVSIEQRIFESKNTYYAALRMSQAHWHDGGHDVWPWTRYLLQIIADAYDDFERKIAAGAELVGQTKHEQARNYILTQAPRTFRLAQIFDALPDISPATIRDAADGLKDDGVLQVGRGRSAVWTRIDEG